MENIKDEDLKNKVVENPKKVLLFFYSPLQVPCLFAERSLENLESQYSDDLTFYKMDIKDAVDTCLKYSVLSVPKMLILDKGNVVAQRMGSASSSVLETFIKAHI